MNILSPSVSSGIHSTLPPLEHPLCPMCPLCPIRQVPCAAMIPVGTLGPNPGRFHCAHCAQLGPRSIGLNPPKCPRLKASVQINPPDALGTLASDTAAITPMRKVHRPAANRSTWAHRACVMGYFWRAFDLLRPLPSEK